MNRYFVFILAVAAATQSAFAGPHEQRPNQVGVPQQPVQREQRVMPVRQQPIVHERAIPAVPVRQQPIVHERAIPAVPARQQPIVHERAIPAVPVRQQPIVHERAIPAVPVRQQPIVHERAIPAVPVRERTRPMMPVFRNDNSAAAAVWRDQHERSLRVREMPRVFRSHDDSAPTVVVRHVEFERFHPSRVFAANPVFVEPRIVTPAIVATQFIQPAMAAPVFVPGVIENGIAPVSYAYTGYVPMYAPAMIGYAPAFASVPMFDTSYVSYVTPVPFTTYAAYSDDCDDEDGNCYSPSYVSYAQPAYTYVGSPVNPFGNAQLQGVVIGQTGDSLIVLAPNLRPVFVNTGIAAQAGYMQGSVAPGSVINALGYYVGNQFIATALV